jgi:hypothetical protein
MCVSPRVSCFVVRTRQTLEHIPGMNLPPLRYAEEVEELLRAPPSAFVRFLSALTPVPWPAQAESRWEMSLQNWADSSPQDCP